MSHHHRRAACPCPLSSVSSSKMLVLSVLLLFTSLVIWTPPTTYAFPYVVVRHGNKCMKVDLPEETNIHVHWDILGKEENDMPDMNHIHKDMRQYAHDKKNRHGHSEDEDDSLTMPTILKIQPLYEDPHHHYDPASTILHQPKGVLVYNTQYEGPVEVCISTMSRHPSVVALHVSEYPYGPSDDPTAATTTHDSHGNNLPKITKTNMTHVHLTNMEKMMNHLLRDSKLLLTNAEAVKKEEAVYHQKSIDMNEASRYWPILHLIVLFVTGFTQVNHMVNFFRKRSVC